MKVSEFARELLNFVDRLGYDPKIEAQMAYEGIYGYSCPGLVAMKNYRPLKDDVVFRDGTPDVPKEWKDLQPGRLVIFGG